LVKLKKQQTRALVVVLIVLLMVGCFVLSRMPAAAKVSLPDYLGDLSSVDAMELNARGTTSALSDADREQLLALLSGLRFPDSHEYRHAGKDERAIRRYDPPGQEFTLLLHDPSGNTSSVVFVSSEPSAHLTILPPDGTHLHIIGPFQEDYAKVRSYVGGLLPPSTP